MVDGGRRKGPVPGHSRAEIAAAAVRIADTHGLAAVTMRGVAAQLGTTGASLYRYVATRDDLVDLMVDQVVGEFRFRGSGDSPWSDEMVAHAHTLLRLYRRHPWLVDVAARTVKPGPQVQQYFQSALTLLDPVDASTQAKMEAIAMVTGIVTLFVTQERTATHSQAPPTRGEVAPSPRPELFDKVIRGVLHGVLE